MPYGEKLKASWDAYTNHSSELGNYSSMSIDPFKSNPSGVNGNKINHSGPPFRTSFVGRKDFYNKDIPAELPEDWQMSPNITFKQVYETNRDAGSTNAIASALANEYEYFINAQRFAQEIVEPCVTLGGSLGTNDKTEMWFKLKGKDAHSIALAVSSTFGKQGETDLCDLFKKIFEQKDSLNYDVCRLVEEGGKWAYIHIAKLMNGTNRKATQVNMKGKNKNIRIDKVTSPDDLKIDKVIKVCY